MAPDSRVLRKPAGSIRSIRLPRLSLLNDIHVTRRESMREKTRKPTTKLFTAKRVHLRAFLLGEQRIVADVPSLPRYPRQRRHYF